MIVSVLQQYFHSKYAKHVLGERISRGYFSNSVNLVLNKIRAQFFDAVSFKIAPFIAIVAL